MHGFVLHLTMVISLHIPLADKTAIPEVLTNNRRDVTHWNSDVSRCIIIESVRHVRCLSCPSVREQPVLYETGECRIRSEFARRTEMCS